MIPPECPHDPDGEGDPAGRSAAGRPISPATESFSSRVSDDHCPCCACDCADCYEPPEVTEAEQAASRKAYADKQLWAISEPDTFEKSLYRAKQEMIHRLEERMFGLPPRPPGGLR